MRSQDIWEGNTNTEDVKMELDYFINIATNACINGAFNSITVFFVYKFFLKHVDDKNRKEKKGEDKNWFLV